MSALLSATFNQTTECIAVGSTSGFRVYNVEPFRETFCRGFGENGGIGIVEMLFRCNILAIVGGGVSPRYPPNKVMIWDDHQGKCIGELAFRSQVRAVRLRRDRVVVALEHKVLVYKFADLSLQHQIETLSNPKGLVALSSAADSTVLACPGLHTGQIRIELYERKQTKFISAHHNALSCLALSLEGKRLASASDKGTLVRVWNTADGQLLQELRRGADPACINSLALSRGCEWLAVSSDKGTVHVFALSEAVQSGVAQAAPSASPSNLSEDGSAHAGTAADTGKAGTPVVAVAPGASAAVAGGSPVQRPASSLLSLVKSIVPVAALPKYFTSEWSWAQFRVPGFEEGCKATAGFGQAQSNVLYVITTGGAFFKVSFDTVKGGPCTQEAYTRFTEAAATT